MKHASLIDIMRATVRDLGGTRQAADYCESIARAGGEDSAVYREAAERLRKLTAGAERAAAYRDKETPK